MKRLSMAASLVIDILIVGTVGVILVLVTAGTYRDLAFKNQEESLTELAGLAAAELMTQLDSKAIDFGMSIQRDEELRRDLLDSNREQLAARLDRQFHQVFVTAGVIKLEKLYVFDHDLNFVVASHEGRAIRDSAPPLCPDLLQAAKRREGPDRLKPLSQLCSDENGALFGELVAIGGLRVLGYILVIADPAYNLTPVEGILGLPAKLLYPNGKLVFKSSIWPVQDTSDDYITARHVLRDPTGKSVLMVNVVRDVGPFRASLEQTTRHVLLGSAIAITFTIMLALIKMRRSLAPLDELKTAVEKLGRGEFTQVSRESYPEIDEPIRGFNRMARKITDLIGKLESEIAERKRVENDLLSHREELEEARDQAFASNRAKSAFLANMSHELRTPLNAIIGYSEMLEENDEIARHGQMVGDLQRISGSARHLLGLINEILDLSKIEAGRMECVCETLTVKNLVEEAVDDIRPMLERNQNSYLLEISPNLTQVCSDGTKLRQIVLNLLSNAAKFTQKGSIMIKVGFMPGSNGRWFQIQVTDTGIGIAGENLDKLFGEFSQLHSSIATKYGGTGLGLALSQRIARLLGGYIVASSELNVGTTFVVYLPCLTGAADSERPSQVRDSAEAGTLVSG